MKEDTITYSGFEITAVAREVPASDTWAVVFTISRGSGEDRESWLFSSGDQFDDRDKALKYCFDFGREVIDREMTGDGLQ